jgi:protein subunit release factor B
MDRHSIQERMVRAGILPSDVVESFARSSGPGGQHVNKVSTAVTLLHRPSGTRVTVQDSRSQAINRRLARERLIAAIEERQRANRIARRADRERERRRKSPRPPKLKRQILESKRKRSELKRERQRISE